MAQETRRVLKKIRKGLAKYWRDYRKAKRAEQDAGGGSGYYRPVAADLSNYGAGILCDKQDRAILPFGSAAKAAGREVRG